MKRFSTLAIGIIFLLVGLCTQVFAISGYGNSSGKDNSAKKDAPSALSVAVGDHVIEIFTSLNPDTNYAEKYFFEGETIYLMGSIYLTVPGAISVYTIVTDIGGKVLLIDPYSFTATSNYPVFWYSTDSLPAGIYNFHVLVGTEYGFLLSPTAFTFVVL
jgi:hypothetical protein